MKAAAWIKTGENLLLVLLEKWTFSWNLIHISSVSLVRPDLYTSYQNIWMLSCFKGQMCRCAESHCSVNSGLKVGGCGDIIDGSEREEQEGNVCEGIPALLLVLLFISTEERRRGTFLSLLRPLLVESLSRTYAESLL